MGLNDEKTRAARQRLTLMQQSGVSQQITRSQQDERRVDGELAAARQANHALAKKEDLEVLRQMLFLMKGVKEISQSLPQAQRDTSYNGNKRLVRAIVGTQPKGPRKIGDLAVTATQLLDSAVVTTVTMAANATNSTIVRKTVTAMSDVYGVGSSVTGVVGAVWPNIPPLPQTITAAGDANVTNLCLSWWGVASVQPYVPFLYLAAPIAAATSVLNKNTKLDPLLALWLRYDNACSCCGSVQQITDTWQDDMANSAAMLNWFYALYLTSRTLYDKTSHKWAKRSNKDLHRPSYFIAEQLWSTAQNAHGSAHRVATHYFGTIDYGQHCPLALLVLATLFGKGQASQGYQKAVAAVMSDRSSAIEKIRGLLS